MIQRRTKNVAGLFDPQHFVCWDGVGRHPYFGEIVGYATSDDARAAWAAARRTAWAATYQFDVPEAAKTYDGLTRDGFDLLWLMWAYQHFDAEPVLEAVAADMAAVDRFVRRDRDGAAAIADFLAIWRANLAMIREVAEACGRADYVARLSLNVVHRISSAHKYGDDAMG